MLCYRYMVKPENSEVDQIAICTNEFTYIALTSYKKTLSWVDMHLRSSTVIKQKQQNINTRQIISSFK